MRITVRALEDVMTDGWRAVEEVPLGEWLLRASSGFTQRGNSALALGDPGCPIPAAIETVERWYAARNLTPRFSLVTDSAGVCADPALAAQLEARGYLPGSNTQSMVAQSAEIPRLLPGAPSVDVDEHLTSAWFTAFAAYRSIVPGAAEAILTGSHGQVFLSVPPAGAVGQAPPIAIARMSTYPGWAGIHAMWVAPQRRREGLATAVAATAARLAVQAGMPQLYLQVERTNDAARAAYGRLGFLAHHGHLYYAPTAGRTERS